MTAGGANTPDVLDVLIVGAGPFGTAAAFRAKELGLSALVIDHDDVLKRIRDYAKDKQILPDYGGGDRMEFPDGGEVIKSLAFEAIDKDELCARWKSLYQKYQVAVRIGLELTGLRRGQDAWIAAAMNHTERREEEIAAKHVVIGVGRGVPRQLDVPGDLTGISFAMTAAARFCGAPVCVIGGGTSAAEAVIAISHAKVAASDPSGVFWSHRGQKMPKVSQALAGAFFEAFAGNGNIRYLPGSEPVAATGAGADGHLSLRTERIETPNQPTSVSVLEFGKMYTVACIGEDVPEQFLARLGVPLVENDTGKKRALVTPVLESQLPDVYLAGDTLSPMYLETSDFSDRTKFAEVRRRGNIKAAMRDGVLILDAIAQKRAGRQVLQVPEPSAPPTDADRDKTIVLPRGVTPSPPPIAAARARLVTVLPTGVEAGEYVLPEGVTIIGKITGDLQFPGDDLLSDKHAEIVATPRGFVVRDAGSTRGTFLRPNPAHPVTLTPPALIFAGNQWFGLGDKGKDLLVHYLPTGKESARFPLPAGPVIVGRESPDITVASSDRALSRRHFSVTTTGDSLSVRDLGSANGTFIRLRGDALLQDGDCVIVGQQTLRFIHEEAVQMTGRAIEVDLAAVEASRVASFRGKLNLSPTPASKDDAPDVQTPPAPIPMPAGPAVTFAGARDAVPCDKGEAICDVAKRTGLKLDADCHRGLCGMDPVEVTGGAEHLTAMGRTEKDTLEDICGLDPRTHRLACMAKVTGPVSIHIVSQKNG